jgi:hypothetical protein
MGDKEKAWFENPVSSHWIDAAQRRVHVYVRRDESGKAVGIRATWHDSYSAAFMGTFKAWVSHGWKLV